MRKSFDGLLERKSTLTAKVDTIASQLKLSNVIVSTYSASSIVSVMARKTQLSKMVAITK